MDILQMDVLQMPVLQKPDFSEVRRVWFISFYSSTNARLLRSRKGVIHFVFAVLQMPVLQKPDFSEVRRVWFISHVLQMHDFSEVMIELRLRRSRAFVARRNKSRSTPFWLRRSHAFVGRAFVARRNKSWSTPFGLRRSHAFVEVHLYNMCLSNMCLFNIHLYNIHLYNMHL